MKHYDYIEWIFYKEGVFSIEKQIEMEEHLYTCDKCMDIFLSLIDKKEVDKAEEFIPQNFTVNIMDKIKNVQYKPKVKVKKTIERTGDMIIYYAAVASVTIVLTLGGVYNGLVDMVPKVSKLNVVKSNINAPNIVADISGRIVDGTSDFINNFKIFNGKEVVK